MEGDIEAKADYAKMEKVARLVYLVALDIGDKPALLKLDLRPDVTARGPENMKVGVEIAALLAPGRVLLCRADHRCRKTSPSPGKYSGSSQN